MPTTAKAPTSERTELLDALRGFALFGVVVSNYAVFSYWLFLRPEQQAQLPGALFDHAVEAVHGPLIDAKFYSLFSLLFGIGFHFFLQKGSGGRARFLRRMLVLLGIGWLHLRYLWGGDILFLYAALGLLLPLFAGLRDRTLLWLAGLMFAMPIALDAATIASGGAFRPTALVQPHLEAAMERLRPVLGDDPDRAVADGGLREFLAYGDIGVVFRIEHLLGDNRLPKVFGLFLLGLWIAKRQLFVDPARHRVLLTRVLRFGLLVGLPMAVLAWSTGSYGPKRNWNALLPTVAFAFGAVPLALGYASGFALLWTRPAWQRRLALLAPMGRMALTNYLTQTLVGLALFTGMGLGLGTRVSAITFTGIAIALYVAQTIVSTWWLREFRFGPCEWAWRCLTYGQWMPMRR